MIKSINNYFQNNKFEILILVLLSFVYILPRIISNSDYNDDIFRSTTGDAYWWYYNARPLNVWVMRAFNQNALMSDSTPLPVILGMTFLVFCSLTVMSKFLNGYSSYIKVALCAVFLLNPFFVSNITYKYDCLPMCLSLGLAIIAALLGRNKTSVYIELSRFFVIISILCLYQASLSLIISLVAIELCVRSLTGNINIPFQITRIITIVFSYIVYSKFIAPHYLDFIYVDMAQHIPFNHTGILILKRNIQTSLNVLRNFYHTPLMRLCLFSYFSIYLFGFFSILFKENTEYKTKKIFLLCSYLGGLLIIFLCALGLTIFLKSPDIQPRVFLGTFPFILSAPLFLIYISRKPALQFLCVMICMIQIIPTLSLSFSFGNYLTQEATHDRDALKEIQFHLAHYTTNPQTKITLLNDNPATPSMIVKQTVHPIIANFMATQGFGKNYGWYSGGLLKFNNINYELDNTYDLKSTFTPEVKTCHVLSAFTENHILVMFRDQC